MASVVGLAGLSVIVLVNTAIAALLTRFFRVRLETSWGSVVYTALLVPFALTLSVIVLSGVFALGGNVGDRGTVVGVTILAPLLLGVTFDYFWMPAPEEVDLPDQRSA